MKRIFIVFLLFLINAAFNMAFSETYTWNVTDGSWNSAANWSPEGVPGVDDNVVINSGTLTLDVPESEYSINNLTMSGGVVDLGSLILTVNGLLKTTGGVINNGILLSNGSFASLAETTFGCSLTINCEKIAMENSTFSDVELTKTGTSNDAVFGGNSFTGIVKITKTGTGGLYFGTTSPDKFMSDVYVDHQNGYQIIFGYTSDSTEFHGDVYVASSNTNNSWGINFGWVNGATIYGSTIFAPGSSIKIDPDKSFDSGYLAIYNSQVDAPLDLTVSRFVTKNSAFGDDVNIVETANVAEVIYNCTFSGALNINSVSKYTIENTAIDGILTLDMPSFNLKNSTFSDVNLTKTAGGDDVLYGGNTFNGVVRITKTSPRGLYFGANAPDKFMSDVYADNQNGYNIIFGYIADSTEFHGDVTVACSTEYNYGINFGWTNGTTIFAPGKTVKIDPVKGFDSGYLGFRNSQIDAPIDISLSRFYSKNSTFGDDVNIEKTGTTADVIDNSIFNGALNINSIAQFTIDNTVIADSFNIDAPKFYLKNSTFNGVTDLLYTGASSASMFGGNTFNALTKITKTGNGYLYFGNTAPDKFMSDLTVDNQLGNNIIFSVNADSTEFHGDVTISNSTDDSYGISFGWSGSTYFEPGKTIKVDPIKGFDTGILYIRKSEINAPLDIKVARVYINNSIFSDNVKIEKTSDLNNESYGGNTFNGTFEIVKTGSGYMYFDRYLPSIYNSDVIVRNLNEIGSVAIGYYTLENQINGDLIVSNIATGNYGVSLGYRGSATFAPGKTIKIGEEGFDFGKLYLYNTSLEALTNIKVPKLEIVNSTFNDNVNIEASIFYLKNSTFNGVTELLYTGASNASLYGGNTFNSLTKITKTGNGYLYFGQSASDKFMSDLIVDNQFGQHIILGLRADSTEFHGDVTVSNSTAENYGISFGSGQGGRTYFAQGKTIKIDPVKGFDSGILYIQNTQINAQLDIKVARVYLKQSTFNESVKIEKTSTVANESYGGNTFNGTFEIIKTGAGYMYFDRNLPSIYNSDVILNNLNETGSLSIGHYTQGNEVNGDIYVSNTATGDWGINIGHGGTVTLAEGKTIKVGEYGFGTGRLYLYGTTVNSPLDIAVPRILIAKSTFNDSVKIEKTGTLSDASYGENIFHGSLELIKSGTGNFIFDNNVASTYNSDVFLKNRSEKGYIFLAHGGANQVSQFNGDVYVSCNSLSDRGGISIGYIGSAVFATGKTVKIGEGGLNENSEIWLRKTTFNAPFNLEAPIMHIQNSIFNDKVDSKALSYSIKKSTFNDKVDIIASSYSINNSTFTDIGDGPDDYHTFTRLSGKVGDNSSSHNIYNGNICIIHESQSRSFYGGGEFNKKLKFINKSESGLITSSYVNGATIYKGDIEIISENGARVQFGNVYRPAYFTEIQGNIEISGPDDLYTQFCNVTINGTTDQTISGPFAQFWSGYYSDDTYSLVLDKSSGNLIIESEVQVVGEFTLLQGNILLKNQLNLRHSMIGGDENNHIKIFNNGILDDIDNGKITINNSFINNSLTNNPNDSLFFPIGKNGYSPVELKFVNWPSMNNYSKLSISVIDEDEPHLECKQNHISRYWKIEDEYMGNYEAELTFNYLDTDLNGDETNMQAISWSKDNGLNNVGTVDPDSNKVVATITDLYGLNNKKETFHFTADKSSEPFATADFTSEFSANSNNLVKFTSTGENIENQSCIHSWDFDYIDPTFENESSDAHPYNEYTSSTAGTIDYIVKHKVESGCYTDYFEDTVQVTLTNPTIAQTSNDAFTITPVNGYDEILVTKCDGEAEIKTTIENTSQDDIFIDRLTLYMPVGMKYIEGSISGIAFVDKDLSVYNEPYFSNIGIIPAGQSIEVSYKAKSFCNLEEGTEINTRIDFKLSEGAEIYYYDESDVKVPISEVKSPNVGIAYKNVSGVDIPDITLLPSKSKYVAGDIISRSIKIENTGSAPITEFVFVNKHDAPIEINGIDLGDYEGLQIIDETPVPIANNGDDDIIRKFRVILPEELTLYPVAIATETQKTSLILKEEVAVLCASMDKSESEFHLEWGCESDLCNVNPKTDIYELKLLVSEPVLVLNDALDNMNCYGNTEESHTLTISNNSVPVSNLTLAMSTPEGSYSKIKETEEGLPTTFEYIHYDIDGTTVLGQGDLIKTQVLMLSNSNGCGDDKYVKTAKYKFAEGLQLRNGEKIKVQWQSYSCCPEASSGVSNATFYPYDFNFNVTYTDLCGDETIEEDIYTTNYRSQHSPLKMLMVYEGPSDLTGPWNGAPGEIGEFAYECNEINLWKAGDSETGFLEVVVDMSNNVGESEDGNIGLIYVEGNELKFRNSAFVDFEPTTLIAYNENGNVVESPTESNLAVKVVARFDYDEELFKYLQKGDLIYELTTVCPNTPKTYFNLLINYYPESDCGCGIPLVDVTRPVQVHCPGCTTHGTLPTFKIARISTGEQDNNHDGIADTGNDIIPEEEWREKIKLNRAITGDILEGTLVTNIWSQPSLHPIPLPEPGQFNYCYLGIDKLVYEGYDVDLNPVGNIILKVQEAGNDFISASLEIPVKYLNEGDEGYDYFLDLSPETLNGYADVVGNYPGGYHFKGGDRIFTTIQYQVGENNIPAGKIENVELNHHIYMGLAPYPNCDPGTCDPSSEGLEMCNGQSTCDQTVKYWCEKYAGNFSVAGFYQDKGTANSTPGTCEKMINSYVDFDLYTGNSKFFDYEYRNFGRLASHEVIQPKNYTFDYAKVYIIRTAGNSKVEDEVEFIGTPSVSQYAISSNDIRNRYTFDLSGYFTGEEGGLHNPDESFRIGVKSFFKTDCSNSNSNLTTHYQTGNTLEFDENQSTVGAISEYPLEESPYSQVIFRAPILSMSSHEVIGITNEVQWNLTVKNSGGAVASHIWLNFDSYDGITVTKVKEENYTGNGHYIGSVGAGQSVVIPVRATYECPEDINKLLFLNANASWTCAQTGASDACKQVSHTLTLQPTDVSLIGEITNRDDLEQKNLCEEYDIHYRLYAGGWGTVSDLDIIFNKHNNPGIVLTQSPRLIYNDNEYSLSSNALNWNIPLIVGEEWDKGIRYNDVLEFVFPVKTTDGFQNPGLVSIEADGYSHCNELIDKAISSVNTDILFDPIVVPADVALELSNGVDFEACDDNQTTVDLSVANWAAGDTRNSYLKLTMPEYFSYVSGMSYPAEQAVNENTGCVSYIFPAENFSGSITISRDNSTNCHGYVRAELYISEQRECAVVAEQLTSSQMEIGSNAPVIEINNNIPVDVCAGLPVAFEATSPSCLVPETYQWTFGDGASAKKVTNPSHVYNKPGTYTVTLTAGTGAECVTSQATYTVNVVGVSLSLTSTDISCNGGNNGTATVQINGGIAPYAFNWSDGQYSQTANNLFATEYSVTVTDNTGCNAAELVSLSEPTKLDATAYLDRDACYDVENGEVSALAIGGTTPYIYNWAGGETTKTVAGLNPGDYHLTVTDKNGCQVERFATVNELPQLFAGVTSITDVLCKGEATGAININVTGGSSEYTYLWSNGARTQNLINVIAGEYTVTATDKEACTITVSETITEPREALSLEFVTSNLTCKGSHNGSIDMSVKGGVEPYSISWSNDTTVEDLGNLSAGNYTVTVTDANGCSITETITITEPDELVAAINTDTVIHCAGDQQQLISVVSGGTEAYQYYWNTGANTTSLDVAPTENTIYALTVTDINGCVATTGVEVTVNSRPVANAGTDQAICLGDTAKLKAEGGATYQWNTGEATAEIAVSPEEATTYSVIVTSEHGCQSTDEIVVTVNPLPTANAGADQTICLGEAATLTAEGGETYQWSTDETSAEIAVSPEETTTYSVVVFNEFGCQNADKVVLTVNPLPVTNAGTDQTICLGETATLTADGGVAYQWSTGDTTASITVNPEETTTYSVIAFNEFGCQNADEVVVNVNPLPQTNAGDEQTICFGEAAILTATGGETYLWNTGETTATISVNPTETTTYSVIAFNEFGCQNTDEVVVTVNPLPTANAGADQTICLGETATLTATGGAAYQWDTGEATASISINPEETSSYTVMVTSEHGCQSNDEVVVTVNPLPIANAGVDQTICLGETATLTTTGGSAYEWSNGETSETISVSPIETTTYSIVAFNEFGCQTSDEISVTVNPLPVANAGADQTICLGETATLTANGGITYEWNNGDASDVISVTPEITIIYTVNVTNELGCQNTDDVTINVAAVPTATFSSNLSEDENCLGDIILFTNSNTVENASHSWWFGDEASSVEENPIHIYSDQEAIYMITHIVSTAHCADTSSISVLIEECCPIPLLNCETIYIPYNQTHCGAYQLIEPTVITECVIASITNDYVGGPFSEGETIVTWTAIDERGNVGTCEQTVIYEPQNLFSSYTILGTDRVHLSNKNIVENGSVGVIFELGEATLMNFTTVISEGSFVKAKTINTYPNTEINTMIEQSAIPVLPEFIPVSQTNDVNIVVGTNQSVTLTDTIYGDITIHNGGEIVIDNPYGVINIKSLRILGSDVNILFNQNTNVKVSGTIEPGAQTIINPDYYEVTFYVEAVNSTYNEKEVVGIGSKSIVNANFYVPNGHMQVYPGSKKDNTIMTGTFIAKYITGQPDIIWNGFHDCGDDNEMIIQNKWSELSDENTEDMELTKLDEESFSVYPNPSKNFINVEYSVKEFNSAEILIYDVTGKIIRTIPVVTNVSTISIDIENFPSGIYLIKLNSDNDKTYHSKVVKL